MTVVEPLPTPLHAVLGAEMGQVFAGLHREHGVDVRTGVGVAEFQRLRLGAPPSSRRTAPSCPPTWSSSASAPCPNTGLAEAAGLDVDNGVVTDAALRTSAPDVYAAGDVASAFHPLYGRHVRVEHWANALNQGPAAARSMLGQDVSYDRVPYFFTDQYDLGMEYSGLGSPGRRPSSSGATRAARVHRVLAPGGRGRGRHERQRLGRHRRRSRT